MIDEERKYKYGQFGYGKFVYNKEDLAEMREFFLNEIGSLLIVQTGFAPNRNYLADHINTPLFISSLIATAK